MSFYDDVYKYAKRVKDEIGQPISVTLGQWGWETGQGTSKLFKQSNNLGGIKYSKYSKTAKKETSLYANSGFARYDSLNDFTTDYIRVMKLSYYDNVRDQYDSKSINDDVVALGNSPYAGGPKVAPEYTPGILKLITQNNLLKYDEAQTSEISDSIINKDTKDFISNATANFSDKELILMGSMVAGLFLLLSKK